MFDVQTTVRIIVRSTAEPNALAAREYDLLEKLDEAQAVQLIEALSNHIEDELKRIAEND